MTHAGSKSAIAVILFLAVAVTVGCTSQNGSQFAGKWECGGLYRIEITRNGEGFMVESMGHQTWRRLGCTYKEGLLDCEGVRVTYIKSSDTLLLFGDEYHRIP